MHRPADVHSAGLLLILALLSAEEATAEQRVAPENADVELFAIVSARELMIERIPDVTVNFPGGDTQGRQWTTERRNLPEKLEEETVYRDIGVTLIIRSSLPQIETIVDEALAAVRKSKVKEQPE